MYHNYSLPTCQGRGPRLQACDYTIRNKNRAVPELGYHVGQTSRSHIDWNCLIVQHPQQCGENLHQEMAMGRHAGPPRAKAGPVTVSSSRPFHSPHSHPRLWHRRYWQQNWKLLLVYVNTVVKCLIHEVWSSATWWHTTTRYSFLLLELLLVC